MLYGSNAKKSSPSDRDGRDSFDKNKLADEAKRIRESREAAQKQQEKSHLQLEITNLKRELDRSAIDLRTKEVRLGEITRKLADAKREEFVLKGQIKQKEGGVGYLGDEARSQEGRTAAQEAELMKLKSKRDSVLAEINKLKIESDKLDQEYKSLEIGSKQVAGEKFRVSKDLQTKKKEIQKEEQDLVFKGRLGEELERDQQTITQEIARLNRDRENKEREMKDLERKRDAIGF